MLRSSYLIWLLAAGTLLSGCREQASEPAGEAATRSAASSPATDHEHSHGAGPHDGVIADWGGGKYHVELTVNHLTKEATVYVLGSDARSPAPVHAESVLLSISDPSFQMDLKPVPMEGESGGLCSRFVGTNEGLENVQRIAGTISGQIGGTPYAGDFQGTSHDHHE